MQNYNFVYNLISKRKGTNGVHLLSNRACDVDRLVADA